MSHRFPLLKERWEECLSTKEWTEVSDTDNLNDKVIIYNKLITVALDEIAPVKTFTVKSQYKFGISDSTKLLMAKRDNARLQIKSASATHKSIMMEQYKKLRNKVNALIRKESIAFNNERVKNAKDENEIWKITKDVTSQEKAQSWSIQKSGENIDDELEIANLFNDYFSEKIISIVNVFHRVL